MTQRFPDVGPDSIVYYQDQRFPDVGPDSILYYHILEFNASTKTVKLRLDRSTTYLYDPITQERSYDLVKAKRDVGFVIDAATTDYILNTNYSLYNSREKL